MGCVSSKFVRKDIKKEEAHSDPLGHVVSLTSSTYGVLQLEPLVKKEPRRSPPPGRTISVLQKRGLEEPEVINAWELMHGLEDGIPGCCSPARRTPRKGNPFFNQMTRTPKKQRNSAGKENRMQERGTRTDFSPKSENLQQQASPEFKKFQTKNCSKKPLTELKLQVPGKNNQGFSSSSRRSFSPLFDPELLESFERELSQEREQIKKMVSATPRTVKANSPGALLESLEKKCPPGGEESVVIYTTTLRGIRKTFEECNSVRSAIETHGVQMMERDVSMHSGFKEELRALLGKEVRVPVVFVKGRLVGGAEEVARLEEEGKLGALLEGIPRASEACRGCGGVGFVMCLRCSGSCKVLDEEQKEVVRCGKCNENGLMHCPICCCL